MAVWQFQFALVPRLAIIEHHGTLVDALPDYAAHDPEAPPKPEEEFHDYWKGRLIASASLRELETLLPTVKSWSPEARMFGRDGSDEIQIWNDDIDCALDVRNINIPLLARIIAIAADVDCQIVLKDGGRVLPPSLDVIIAEINASNAMRFARDPRGYMEAHARMATAMGEEAKDDERTRKT